MAETEDRMRQMAELAEIPIHSLSDPEMAKLIATAYETLQNSIRRLRELDLTAYPPAAVLPWQTVHGREKG